MAQSTTKTAKTLQVITQEGKKVSDIHLNQKLFDGSVNRTLLHEAILMYQANMRQGTADTKIRSEISGGGKKPWRQKGTGRARAGSIRSPLWRGGGIIFGPHPRDYSYRLPQKALKKALCCALNDKINEDRITILDKIELDSHKTKAFAEILKKLKFKVGGERVLIVTDKISDNLKIAGRNLRKVQVAPSSQVNARDIMLADKIVLEKAALASLENRVKI